MTPEQEVLIANIRQLRRWFSAQEERWQRAYAAGLRACGAAGSRHRARMIHVSVEDCWELETWLAEPNAEIEDWQVRAALSILNTLATGGTEIPPDLPRILQRLFRMPEYAPEPRGNQDNLAQTAPPLRL